MSTTPTTLDSRAGKIAWRVGAGIGLAAVIVTATASHAYAGPFTQPTPDPNAPGASALKTLTNQVMTYVFSAVVLGFFASLVSMLVGKIFHEPRVVTAGKNGVLISIGVAFIAGLATAILNAAFDAGAKG